MSMTCRYHENRFAACAAPATHRLAFDTWTGRPLGYVLATPPAPDSRFLPEAVFCLTHAGVVSEGVQQRWREAKEARLRPFTRRKTHA